MKPLLIALSALALAACGDDDHGHEPSTEMSDLEIGCSHFEFGPHVDHKAVEMGAEAPTLMAHHHYTLNVPEDGGTVMFAPEKAGTYLFMLSTGDATLGVMQHGADAPLSPAMTEQPGDACAAAAVVHHFELEAHGHMIMLGGVLDAELVIHGPIGGDHGGHDHGEHEHG